jgi:hypothetical protein
MEFVYNIGTINLNIGFIHALNVDAFRYAQAFLVSNGTVRNDADTLISIRLIPLME